MSKAVLGAFYNKAGCGCGGLEAVFKQYKLSCQDTLLLIANQKICIF